MAYWVCVFLDGRLHLGVRFVPVQLEQVPTEVDRAHVNRDCPLGVVGERFSAGSFILSAHHLFPSFNEDRDVNDFAISVFAELVQGVVVYVRRRWASGPLSTGVLSTMECASVPASELMRKLALEVLRESRRPGQGAGLCGDPGCTRPACLCPL